MTASCNCRGGHRPPLQYSIFLQPFLGRPELRRVDRVVFPGSQILDLSERIEEAFAQCWPCEKEPTVSGLLLLLSERVQKCDEAFGIEAGVPRVLDSKLIRLSLRVRILADQRPVHDDS